MVLKILKNLGVGGCILLIVIKWFVIIPVWTITIGLLTGRLFHEWDFSVSPEEWYFNLTGKNLYGDDQ